MYLSYQLIVLSRLNIIKLSILFEKVAYEKNFDYNLAPLTIQEQEEITLLSCNFFHPKNNPKYRKELGLDVSKIILGSLMSKIILNNCEKKVWNNNCIATLLLNSNSLHIYHEIMTPFSSDIVHFHKTKNQFIFVIHGCLTLIVENQQFELSSNEEYFLKAGTIHNFRNDSNCDVIFLSIADSNIEDRTA